MLPEEDVRVDSYRLQGGGTTLAMTHIPKGISVHSGPGNLPFLKRYSLLQNELERLVRKSQESAGSEVGPK